MPERKWHSKPAFLALIARGVRPIDAARAVGIDRLTAYAWRRKDPEFAQGWLDAREQWVEQAETKLYEAVSEGQPWAIMYALRHWKPDVYSNRVKLTGDPNEPLALTTANTAAIYPKPDMMRPPAEVWPLVPVIEGEVEREDEAA